MVTLNMPKLHLRQKFLSCSETYFCINCLEEHRGYKLLFTKIWAVSVKKGNKILRETVILKLGQQSFSKKDQLKCETIPSLGCANTDREPHLAHRPWFASPCPEQW